MEDPILEIENAANFLRGLWLDPAVPAHAKEAIMAKAIKLEEVVENLQHLNTLYEELQYRMRSLEK